MGCCQSKTTSAVVSKKRPEHTKHEKQRPSMDINGGLTKTSHGSSTIRAAAMGSAGRSCCSQEERVPSGTSRTSASVSTLVMDATDQENVYPITCEESPKTGQPRNRRAGIDDENKLEFEDMRSTSEEWEAPIEKVERSYSECDARMRPRIIEALKTTCVFRGLEKDFLEKVALAMTPEAYSEGEVIIRQGDMPSNEDCMYFVAAGQVLLHISGSHSERQQIIPKKAGWIFGDVSLLFTSPRTASVISSGICVLYSLNRGKFIQLMKHTPNILMLRFLRKLPFLKGVEDNKLIDFGTCAHMKTYKKETEMILQHDLFYIVRRGKVHVHEVSTNGSYLLTRGNYFEPSEDDRYTAATNVELIMVHQSIYQKLGGADLYLQIVEDAIVQILTAIGNISMDKIDVGDIVRKTPIISATRLDCIVESDQVLEHLYVIIKGEVEVHNAAQLRIKRHNGTQYFGETWHKKLLTDGDVIVTSEKIQLVKIPHRVLSKAGIQTKTRRKKSNEFQFASRVVDALPLGYEGPKIQFRDLMLHRVVGEGEYGSVRLASHLPTGEQFALKIMNKAAIKDTKTAEHVIMERKMLVRLDGNPFLVGFRGAYQDERSIYLLMDWVPGGELFSRIIDCGGRLPERHAIFYAANVVVAYGLMHRLDIIYRDLKPENMLIDKNGYLKLADYGFATVADGSAWTVCGTPDYQAPEIISRQGASKASDFWALGVLIYEMLTGDAPFKSPTSDRWDTHRRILSGRFYIPEYISPDAADLINQLLQVHPAKRLGYWDGDLETLKCHPWFKSVNWTELQCQTTTAPFIPKLTNAMDTSCFDYYDTPTVPHIPSDRQNFFGRDRQWSCLWSWIEDF